MAVSIFRTDEEGIHKACNRIKWRPGYSTAGCSIIGKTRCDVYIAYDHLLTRYKTNYDGDVIAAGSAGDHALARRRREGRL